MIITAHTIYAQHAMTNNEEVLLKIHADDAGTPYNTTDWVRGTAKQADGKTSNNVWLRYDEISDQLYFKRDKQSEILKFVNPIIEFTLLTVDENNKLIEKRYRNGYPKAGRNTSSSYYEVLYDGEIQLLKKNYKLEVVDKKYITPTWQLSDNILYYLLISGKMITIKPNKKSILAVLGNKHPDFDNLINTNDFDLKNDGNLAKLIAVYNALYIK